MLLRVSPEAGMIKQFSSNFLHCKRLKNALDLHEMGFILLMTMIKLLCPDILEEIKVCSRPILETF